MDFMVDDHADVDEYYSLMLQCQSILPIARDLCAIGKVRQSTVDFLVYVDSVEGREAYEPKFADQIRYYIKSVIIADNKDKAEYERAMAHASPKGYKGSADVSRVSKRKVSK